MQTIAAILPTKETQAYVGGRSRQWLYNQLRKDPTFPRPIQTGPHSNAWIRAELDAWIAARPRALLDGVSALERRAMGSQGAQV